MRAFVLLLLVALVQAQSATQLYCECEVLTTVALDRAIIIVDCNVGADFEVPAQLSTCECAGVTATCTQGANTRQTVNTPGTGFQPELCDDERFVAGNTFDSNTNCNGTCDGGAGYITDDRSDKTVDASSASCDFDYRYTECVNDIPCNRTDCVLSEIEYGNCSQPCGGGQRTFNQTILAQPVNGGEECPDPETLEGFENCNPDPCPIDCEVSNWAAWSDCSQSCNGTQSRVRTVTQNPQFGGEPCPELIETRDCNTGCGEPATDQPTYPGMLTCVCDMEADNVPIAYRNVTVTCTTEVNFAMPDPPLACACFDTSVDCVIGQTTSFFNHTLMPYLGDSQCDAEDITGNTAFDGNTVCVSLDGGCAGLITDDSTSKNVDPGAVQCAKTTRYTNCNNLTNCTSTDCILGEVLEGECSAECDGERNLTQTISQHDASGVACPAPALLIVQEDCGPVCNATTTSSGVSAFKEAGITAMMALGVVALAGRVAIDSFRIVQKPLQVLGSSVEMIRIKRLERERLHPVWKHGPAMFAVLLTMATTVLVSLANDDILDFVYTVSKADKDMIIVGGGVSYAIWSVAIILLQSGIQQVNRETTYVILGFYFVSNIAFWSPVIVERSDTDEGMAWTGVWLLSACLTALAAIELLDTSGLFALNGTHIVCLLGAGMVAGLILIFLVQIHLNHTDW